MKQRFRAKRDRYASRIYVNDEYYNRYFISDNHKSLSEAKRQSRLTKKEESDLYKSQDVRANLATVIFKIPGKKYKRKR